MTGDAIDSVLAGEEDNAGTEADFDDDTKARIEVAISLCLLVGIIQVGSDAFGVDGCMSRPIGVP